MTKFLVAEIDSEKYFSVGKNKADFRCTVISSPNLIRD